MVFSFQLDNLPDNCKISLENKTILISCLFLLIIFLERATLLFSLNKLLRSWMIYDVHTKFFISLTSCPLWGVLYPSAKYVSCTWGGFTNYYLKKFRDSHHVFLFFLIYSTSMIMRNSGINFPAFILSSPCQPLLFLCHSLYIIALLNSPTSYIFQQNFQYWSFPWPTTTPDFTSKLNLRCTLSTGKIWNTQFINFPSYLWLDHFQSLCNGYIGEYQPLNWTSLENFIILL